MHRVQCQGRAVKANEPQRKSDTETRVDPKTSPVPRLEGNPPAVRRVFLFYGKKPAGRRYIASMRLSKRNRDATVRERFFANPAPIPSSQRQTTPTIAPKIR